MSDEEKKVEEQEEPKPVEEEVKEPVEEEEPLPADPLEMDSDQLDKAEEAMIDEETGEIKEEIPLEEKPADEEKAPEEEKPADETPPEKKYDKDGHEITGDPLRDTQATLQREREKRIDAEKKLEQERFKGFEKLDDNDVELLKEEDPDGYLLYKDRERDYESHKSKILDNDINDAHEANRDSVIGFMAKRLELDPNKSSDQERILSLMRNRDSDETKMMIKLDDFLSTNVKPVKMVKVSETDAIPVYSQDQLDAAYKIVYHDEIISSREKAVREATLNKIKEAGEGGSAFDRLGKNEDAGPSGGKKIDEYSQDEIYNMSEEDADRLLKQVDTG